MLPRRGAVRQRQASCAALCHASGAVGGSGAPRGSTGTRWQLARARCLALSRLARLAVTGESAADFCHAPPVAFEAMPESDLRDEAQPRLARFRELYPRLRGAFR